MVFVVEMIKVDVPLGVLSEVAVEEKAGQLILDRWRFISGVYEQQCCQLKIHQTAAQASPKPRRAGLKQPNFPV